MVHRLLLLIGLMTHCYVAKTETDKNVFPQGVASGGPHGFIIADFTLNTTKVDFYAVSTIWSKEYTLQLIHS